MKSYLIIFLFLNIFFCHSQIFESFSDGDFTHNPEWKGTISNFKINDALQLQSNATGASTSYLFTPSQIIINAEWECNFKIDYPTSASNYACMYIISDSCTLENGFNGYFVQVGGTNDEVSLFYQNELKKEKIIDGLDKRIDSKTVDVIVKVTRDSVAFRLYSKLPEEDEFYLEGESEHFKLRKSEYFGLSFTNTNTTGKFFFFDDIKATGEIYSDLLELDTISQGDIIFNEVMFNHPETSAEYIEFYNRSDKTIDVSGLIFTTRKTDGLLNTGVEIPYTTIMKPGDYLAVTSQKEAVRTYHDCPDSANIIQTKWSTLNNETATLVLTNSKKDIIYDEFTYHESFHHALIKNSKGVALERIYSDLPTQDIKNWHSAATTYNYGTPGFQNSQYKDLNDNLQNAIFSLESKHFSPDNDGLNDICIINYNLPESGYIANIDVFTPIGEKLVSIANQHLCNQIGTFIWDGADTQGQIANVGIYVIYIEVFHTERGVRKNMKLPIVISSR